MSFLVARHEAGRIWDEHSECIGIREVRFKARETIAGACHPEQEVLAGALEVLARSADTEVKNAGPDRGIIPMGEPKFDRAILAQARNDAVREIDIRSDLADGSAFEGELTGAE